jgi:glycosyltransferase involved in cell wall biosynthesis
VSPAISIALLHYTAEPVVGGVETVIGRHATLMADAGHAVRIVAGRGESTDARVAFIRLSLADSRNGRVRAIRAELDRGRIPPDFGHLTDELTIALGAATRDVEVVIAHNVATLPMNLALTAALQRLSQSADGPAVVLWHHDIAAAMDAYKGELHPGFPWDLVRKPWPGTTSVAISAARAKVYATVTGLEPSSIHVIADGIDRSETLGLHPTTARFIADQGIDGAAPVLLAPVRLNPRKNLELAVEVLAALRSSMERAALVITGALDPHDPASRFYLDRLRAVALDHGTNDALHILSEWVDGPPTHRLVTDLYRVADGLLLPSRDEGFGLPVLEAALHRLPVFCADIPALREVAGGTAVLFSPDAPPDAIAALIRAHLTEDPAYRAAVRSRDTYDWGAIYRSAIEPLIAGLVRPATGG